MTSISESDRKAAIIAALKEDLSSIAYVSSNGEIVFDFEEAADAIIAVDGKHESVLDQRFHDDAFEGEDESVDPTAEAEADDILTVAVTSRNPEKYLLINREDGSQWEIKNENWSRVHTNPDAFTVLSEISQRWLTLDDDEKGWIVNEVLSAGFDLYSPRQQVGYGVILDDLGSTDEYDTIDGALAAVKSNGGEAVFRHFTDWQKLSVPGDDQPRRVRATVRGIPNQYAYQESDGWWFTNTNVGGSQMHQDEHLTDIVED